MKRDMNFEAKRAKSIIKKCNQDFYSVWIVDSHQMRVRMRLSGYWSRDGIRGDIFHLGAEAFAGEGVKLLYSNVCGGLEDNKKKIDIALAGIFLDMEDFLRDEMGVSFRDNKEEPVQLEKLPETCWEKMKEHNLIILKR